MTRREMIEKLDEYYSEGYCLDSDWIKSVLYYGWTGFTEMSDEQVENLYGIELGEKK